MLFHHFVLLLDGLVLLDDHVQVGLDFLGKLILLFTEMGIIGSPDFLFAFDPLPFFGVGPHELQDVGDALDAFVFDGFDIVLGNALVVCEVVLLEDAQQPRKHRVHLRVGSSHLHDVAVVGQLFDEVAAGLDDLVVDHVGVNPLDPEAGRLDARNVVAQQVDRRDGQGLRLAHHQVQGLVLVGQVVAEAHDVDGLQRLLNLDQHFLEAAVLQADVGNEVEPVEPQRLVGIGQDSFLGQ